MRNNSDPWTGTWLSPNGVPHAVLNGYCVTCGAVHAAPLPRSCGQEAIHK